MEVLRPNEQRAKNAIMLIWIVLAFEIVSVLSGYLLYDLVQTVINGGEISEERASANDMREQVVGISLFDCLRYFSNHIHSVVQASIF